MRLGALSQVVTSDPDEITPAQRMAAGAMAGACAQATIYPFELVRVAVAVCRAALEPAKASVTVHSHLHVLASLPLLLPCAVWLS